LLLLGFITMVEMIKWSNAHIATIQPHVLENV
jgi:hypothetical protein